MNWSDAHEFVSKLKRLSGQEFRLLSKPEWKYAAQGGTTTIRYLGNEIGRNAANCYGCGSNMDCKATSSVKNFAPNSLGQHDMLGNVWKWTCSK